MNDALQDLIASLRHELQEYGEMLARLDQQQELVVARSAELLMQTTSAVDEQVALLKTVRKRREECQRALAQTLKLDGEPTFAHLLPKLPEEFQPLVQALVNENNALLQRVQQRANQNRLLLSRSLELMQGLINALLHAGSPTVYQDDGTRAPAGSPAATLCDQKG